MTTKKTAAKKTAFDVAAAARIVGEVASGAIVGKVKLSEAVADLITGSKFDVKALEAAVAIAIRDLTADALHGASPEARAKSIIGSTVNSVLKAKGKKYADKFKGLKVSPDKFSWKEGFQVVAAPVNPSPAEPVVITAEQAAQMIEALLANGYGELMTDALINSGLAEAA